MQAQEVRVEGDAIAVDVRVTNAGDRYAGKETVQVYASAPEGELDQALSGACGLCPRRGCCSRAEAQTVTLRFPIRHMESYSPARAAYLLEKGEYVLRVGRHSRDTHIAALLTLHKTVQTKKVKNLFALDAPVEEIAPRGVKP